MKPDETRENNDNEPIPNGVRTITHIDHKALAEKWRNMPEPEKWSPSDGLLDPQPSEQPQYPASPSFKELNDLREQLAAANKKIEELEQWKKDQLYIWGPIFAYCDENADRLGIGLGQSISTRVLEILKQFNQPEAGAIYDKNFNVK